MAPSQAELLESPRMVLSPRNDGADQFLNLIQNPFNTELSEKAFWSSLGYSLGAAVLCGLLFCLLRPYNGTVYAPRVKHADEKHKPPPMKNGVFGWIQPVIKTREQVLVDKVGLDAALFMRFTKMCRNILLLLSIVGCGVYIPLNIIENKSNKAFDDTNFFMTLTPLGVWGAACWAHVVVSYAFDGVICFFLWSNYRAVTRLRRDYFNSPEYQESLHSRTLMITDIPKAYRTDDGVSRIVDEVDAVRDPSGIIARNVKGLPELLEEHEEAVRDLEGILAKYLKNPDKLPAKRPKCKSQKGDPAYKPGTKVDAIDYLTSRIERLKKDIGQQRKSVDNKNALPYGFASYQSIEQAHEVAYTAKKKHPQGTTIKLAPKPSDLIWENLPLDRKSRRWRTFMNNLWVTLLTIVWTVPNGLIAVFLANLSNLGSLWPAFQTELERDPRTWGAIQGILAPLVTTLFYLLLPVIFRRLSIYAGDHSRTARERHVTHKLYAFFIFNNLIVFSLFSTAWKYGTAVANAQQKTDLWSAIVGTDPFGNLMTAFCDVSPFWLNYLLQRNFGAALDISQLVKLAQGYVTRKLLNPTPRELIELTAPPPFDYAAYYNNFLYYSTIALIFAPFQPLVLPVTALYFTVDSYLKKYLLLYVFITKHESGGSFWRLLFNRILFATLLANVVTTLFIVARKESLAQIFVMIPLLVLLAGFKWYCRRTFDDDQHFYSTRSTKGREDMLPKSAKRDRVGVRFGHPALYKKLMVPMVHARSQHLLKDVCHGHVDTGLDGASGYSDTYRMQRMSAQNPGQPNTNATPAPFEIVNVADMNFEHFRDHAEFREQFGGDGELYGRPSDQSRPGTPSTIRPSRVGSPASFNGRPYDADGTATPEYEGATYPAGYFRPSPLRRTSSETSTGRAQTRGEIDEFSDVNLLGAAAPLGHSSPARRPLERDRL
ncbi:Uu.00g107220.m01.CDS01 [Anthostomella pinea]|uniref:Uu.00g107220.m01.CDS01 n=1 Tax=Anthostomella pinea TaxID=933095 RepID=A0AAI8YFV8_9PEZI|nr:Uu.00g107220.m01.CDS01 [Anthostomella pinea]